MSYQVGATCYSSASAALSASASAQLGAVVMHGGAAYVVGVDSVGSSSITYRFTPISSGQQFVSVIPLEPQPCGLLGWADGLTLGWGIAAVWIATAAIMHLRKAVDQ